MEPVNDGHTLGAIVSQDGYCRPHVVCPFIGHDYDQEKMQCCAPPAEGAMVNHCFVVECIGDVGWEAFRVPDSLGYELKELPLPIVWWWEGYADEAELWIEPANDSR